jgi:hypothetical protein
MVHWWYTKGEEPTMKTKKITVAKAEQVRKSIVKTFGAEEGPYGPQWVADWGYGAPFTIIWEEGPYEWTQQYCTMAAGYESIDEEFGFKRKASKYPVKGVFLEPVNSYALSIYPEG